MRRGAILLPGIITPASLFYGELRNALGADERALILQELAVYDDEAPPSDYGLPTEIAATLAAADSAGFDRFHLVGYSFGGAVAAALVLLAPRSAWQA